MQKEGQLVFYYGGYIRMTFGCFTLPKRLSVKWLKSMCGCNLKVFILPQEMHLKCVHFQKTFFLWKKSVLPRCTSISYRLDDRVQNLNFAHVSNTNWALGCNLIVTSCNCFTCKMHFGWKSIWNTMKVSHWQVQFIGTICLLAEIVLMIIGMIDHACLHIGTH